MRQTVVRSYRERALALLLSLAAAVAPACTDDPDRAVSDAAPEPVQSAQDAGAETPPALTPIPAPVADDCITDVSAGDHTFTCQGLTFLVMVDEQCTKNACGLIFDVHGGTMSGKQMRDNTKLHELAPQRGYLVVHPSATPENTGGSWDFAVDPPKLADFMQRMIAAFHVDQERVHVTGFSMGSGMTFWFLCNHPDLLASTAPISGASADMVTELSSGRACLDAIDEKWAPRVPILFMSGTLDKALTIDLAHARVDGLVSRLGLSGGEQIEGDGHYSRKRWTGDGHMVLDFIEHDYGGQALLDGHCIPGGTDVAGSPNNFSANATTCTTGDIKLNWGEVALQWFIDHPRAH
jgi:poly(3-hydroxybutyrate) depolymerase